MSQPPVYKRTSIKFTCTNYYDFFYCILLRCQVEHICERSEVAMKVRPQAEPGSNRAKRVSSLYYAIKRPSQGKSSTGTEAVGRGAHHASKAGNGIGTRSVQGCPLVN